MPAPAPLANLAFSERLTVAIPLDLRVAIEGAARRQDLTLADYVRAAVVEKLTRDGVGRPSIPHLRRRSRLA